MAVTDGDIVKAVVTLTGPTQGIAQNVYYWRLDDPTPDNPSNSQILSAVDTRLDDMYAKIDDAMDTDYDVDDFVLSRIEWNVDHWETVENLGESTLAIAGIYVGDAVPHGVAGIVTAQTLRPQTRARKFLYGLAEAEIADSTWSGAVLGWIAQFIVSWLTDQVVVGSAELIPVVVGQSGPSAGLVYALISAGASALAGYQRRRKPGVGA